MPLAQQDLFTKNHDGKLSDELTEPKLIDEIICAGDEIAAAYEAREFAKVTRLIMACADKANEYIDTQNHGH